MEKPPLRISSHSTRYQKLGFSASKYLATASI
jgi:hypothetical protein